MRLFGKTASRFSRRALTSRMPGANDRSEVVLGADRAPRGNRLPSRDPAATASEKLISKRKWTVLKFERISYSLNGCNLCVYTRLTL